MSNALAIAAVTSTLRYLLDAALGGAQPGGVGGASVTTLHPSRLFPEEGDPPKCINLFLYRTTPNHAWNLTDLPTRGTSGGLVNKPVAALDLHYLISCTGEDSALDAQRLLGRAILALATNPGLSRDLVARALTEYGGEVQTSFLADSDLADAVELVKIAPENISLEDESRLWTTLGSKWMLSATYVATVVTLEPAVTPLTALPVLARNLAVDLLDPPVIAGVAAVPPGTAIATGTTVEVLGSGLLAGEDRTTSVSVGGADLVPRSASAHRLEATIDDTVRAGVHPLAVVHRSIPGAPGEPPKVTARSNGVAVTVRPRVTATATTPTTITVTIEPPRFPMQRAAVLLDPLGPANGRLPVSLSIDPLPATEAPNPTITLSREAIGVGDWLVRLRVDGTDSIPEFDGEALAQPRVTLA